MKINIYEWVKESRARESAYNQEFAKAASSPDNKGEGLIRKIDKLLAINDKINQELVDRARIEAGYLDGLDPQQCAATPDIVSIENDQWEFDKERFDDWVEGCGRSHVEEALKADAMIRVRSINDASGSRFEISLRPKGEKNEPIHLYCYINRGGLHTSDGSTILYPYEFSMQKYQGRPDLRAATQYVRRKFAKMVGA